VDTLHLKDIKTMTSACQRVDNSANSILKTHVSLTLRTELTYWENNTQQQGILIAIKKPEVTHVTLKGATCPSRCDVCNAVVNARVLLGNPDVP
jgi:hypothetical protein